jgi:hypothetical protein
MLEKVVHGSQDRKRLRAHGSVAKSHVWEATRELTGRRGSVAVPDSARGPGHERRPNDMRTSTRRVYCRTTELFLIPSGTTTSNVPCPSGGEYGDRRITDA